MGCFVKWIMAIPGHGVAGVRVTLVPTQHLLLAAGQALPGGIRSNRRVAMKRFLCFEAIPPFSSFPDAKTPTVCGASDTGVVRVRNDKRPRFCAERASRERMDAGGP